MRIRPGLYLALLIAAPLFSQTAPTREVRNGTLISKADPAASFSIDSAFHFAGAQTIDILKVAGAEQYFFIDAAADHSVHRFYWLQFEHYYPATSYTYDYSEMKLQPVQLGRIGFMGDVRTRANYFTMDDRPGSDSKAAENFLRARGYGLNGTFVTLRLFFLPDTTRRRELMIIYGEVLPSGQDSSQMESTITAHGQAGIRIP